MKKTLSTTLIFAVLSSLLTFTTLANVTETIFFDSTTNPAATLTSVVGVSDVFLNDTAIQNNGVIKLYKVRAGAQLKTAGDSIEYTVKHASYNNTENASKLPSLVASDTAEVPHTGFALDNPGKTYIVSAFTSLRDIEVFFAVEVLDNPIMPEEGTDTTVVKNAAKVLINGTETTFEAYTIMENNYFKLRDLASVISGTSKQFNVVWNTKNNAIELSSRTPYTAVGGEMQIDKTGTPFPVRNTAQIYLNGVKTTIASYTIGENNYFKLRDVASLFNIFVGYDGTNKIISVDTNRDYVK